MLVMVSNGPGISKTAVLDKDFLLMINTGKLLELLVVIHVSDVMHFNIKADVQDRAVTLRNIQNDQCKFDSSLNLGQNPGFLTLRCHDVEIETVYSSIYDVYEPCSECHEEITVTM